MMPTNLSLKRLNGLDGLEKREIQASVENRTVIRRLSGL